METVLLFDGGDEVTGALLPGEVDPWVARALALDAEIFSGVPVSETAPWARAQVRLVWWDGATRDDDTVELLTSPDTGLELWTEVVL